MAYKLEISYRAKQQIDQSVQYITNNLKSYQGANSILDDLDDALQLLESYPESFAYCEDYYLFAKGYRKYSLKKHNYLLVYFVKDNTVYVIGFFHMLENYQTKL